MRQMEPDFSFKNMIFANVLASKNLRAVSQSDRNNINTREAAANLTTLKSQYWVSNLNTEWAKNSFTA